MTSIPKAPKYRPMSKCALCSSPKLAFECDVCQIKVCKKCAELIQVDDFSFLSKKPEVLCDSTLCTYCFDARVAPEKLRYDELMEKAKNVYFLTRNSRTFIRIFDRHAKRVAVGPCADRRESIMRVAFLAAELNFNAIIECEVNSSKVRKDGGYQSSTWQCSGVPANIDGEKLEASHLRGF